MAKAILSGPEALTKILSGVNLIANAVKATLGPYGRNCVYERAGTNQPVSTRDGVTVAEQIQSSDPFENIGVEMVKGVAREAVDSSGDGTTTATLLAQAIFGEGIKAITVGANPVALKRGLDRAARAVVDRLKDQAIPVSGDMVRVRQVATISANNDTSLGSLISSAIEHSGEDGVVTIDISRKPESELEIVDGMQIGTGFLSPYFITNAERNECVLENVRILLYEQKLSTILPMQSLLQDLAKSSKSLLIIAEDVTDEALAVLSISAQKGPLKCVAVKTPGGVDHLQDIAALTGATVITELSGIKLNAITETHLGRAKKIISKPQSTTIISDSGGERLAQRKQQLRTQIEDARDEAQRLRLQSRLARLAGGVAVIKVGAATELEMLERKDRVDDALHATRCAIKEGVVAGGGIALIKAADAIPSLSGDEGIGCEIIAKACKAPLFTLAENCGESPLYIYNEIIKSGKGWNALTREFGDMFEMGVIDPLRVVRVALESAASVAALGLITHCIVANERTK